MKFNSLLSALLIATMFSCGTNSGNNQQENQAVQEQNDVAIVVEETPILSLDKDNAPKSLQKIMDAQQLSADEQQIYLDGATKLIFKVWKEVGEFDTALFKNLNFKYYVLAGESNGIQMSFDVAEDDIKVIQGDGRAADSYKVTALEIGKNGYTVTYDQYDTPVTVKYISNKEGYMLTNDKMSFILYDSIHLLPNVIEGGSNPSNDMEYWEELKNKNYRTTEDTPLYLDKNGRALASVLPNSLLIPENEKYENAWKKYLYLLSNDGNYFTGIWVWLKAEDVAKLKPPYIEFGKDQLAIKGKDIWVRDAPATGKVVMKLNEGNKCTVFEKGFFEIIRGDADFWYRIEFEGQQGWVFGAQTSYKNMQEPISAATPNALWSSFKKYQKNWVDNENKGNPEEYGKYIYTENQNKFNVVWEGEGPSSFDYSLNAKSTEDLCIISETAEIGGAMGFRNKWSTFLGVKSGTEFKMDPDWAHKFDGKVENLIKVNEGEYILFTYQDSGEGIALGHESYYNVFYINTSKNTVRMIESKLGLVYRKETAYNARNGYAILGASLEFIPNTTSFTLNEERHTIMEDENGYPSYTPFDTLTTTCTWDAKKKTYVKE